MIDTYTKAVDYLHTVMDLMKAVWSSDKHPEIQTDVHQSFRMLTENPMYEGDRPKVN